MGDAEIELAPKAPPLHRSHRHRVSHWAVLVFNSVVALACFVGAGVLVIGQQLLDDTQKSAAIEAPQTSRPVISTPSTGTTTPETTPESSPDTVGPGETAAPTTEAATTTTEAFPVADPQARNFLITGSDNQACPDADSANPVPERNTLGERSDTIMIMRVDPSTSRAAVLSFPRDLWVKIAGSNGKNRINSAFVRNDPQKLIDTIALNFGIIVDHSIQVDFCAFKTLVDAVGGVSVYFTYPARDAETGLDVPVAEGCYTFNGDAALAYVRSRHYKYLDPATGKYKEDPASDFGRISRQQDFLRRAVAKILSLGFDLDLARSLIDVAQNYVVVDKNLTIEKELQFAGVLRNLDPQTIQTYQIEGRNQVIGGAAVIVPSLNGDNMKAILQIFQGWSQLATAPEQIFESTTTSLPNTTTTDAPATSQETDDTGTDDTGTADTGTESTTRPASTSTTTTTTLPATTTTVSLLPESVATEINKGIYPPKDKVCP